MIRILGTTFAALLGIAFGSFLNVCLSRWPAGESIVHPRSHCRNCAHTLAWWENIPLLSWLILRGRCRSCHNAIGIRYPLVELTIGILWATVAWRFLTLALAPNPTAIPNSARLAACVGQLIFYWLLIALAMLDAEHLWLPDFLTLPGIALGLCAFFFPEAIERFGESIYPQSPGFLQITIERFLSILAATSLILLIRWSYKLIRHQEGIGLGDAKLMAMLAAWIGLPGAILSFVLAAILGTAVALVVLAIPSARTNPQSWATSKLPLGTFLCIGGIVTSLWGQPIIAAYLRWAGL